MKCERRCVSQGEEMICIEGLGIAGQWGSIVQHRAKVPDCRAIWQCHSGSRDDPTQSRGRRRPCPARRMVAVAPPPFGADVRRRPIPCWCCCPTDYYPRRLHIIYTSGGRVWASSFREAATLPEFPGRTCPTSHPPSPPPPQRQALICARLFVTHTVVQGLDLVSGMDDEAGNGAL